MSESTLNYNRLKTYLNPIDITEAEVIVAPPASVVDAADENNDESIVTVMQVKPKWHWPMPSLHWLNESAANSHIGLNRNHLGDDKCQTSLRVIKSN
jgi:hypothetical protein